MRQLVPAFLALTWADGDYHSKEGRKSYSSEVIAPSSILICSH